MSESKAKLDTAAKSLRSQIAEAQAKLETQQARLAKIEAQLDGKPAPTTGLDLLWDAALPIARTRSSKIQCRTEWNRIPVSERPKVADAVAALKIWNRSEEWRKDGNSYVPVLHRWIKNRQWENLPEVVRVVPSARYSTPQKPIPADDSETVSDPEEIARFLGLKPTPKKP